MKRLVRINDESCRGDFCDNRISNTKYTLLNFLPMNLQEQFRRFLNQYFLLIACLQLWAEIAPVSPATVWAPLIIIFSISAMKEAWDDYYRYLADKKANERKVQVVKDGILKQIEAQEIRVGDIVWLQENDEVPCDIVLLGSSDPQGICYVETAALDGETDLKIRTVPPICIGLSPELLQKIRGVIECPSPDNSITRLDANVRLCSPSMECDVLPLTISNTLLQSCYLRITNWACGVAVYTGNETKLGMSRGCPEPKLTAVDAIVDKFTAAIFLLQIFVVTISGFAGNIWNDTQAEKHWYLRYPNEGPWYGLLVIPLRLELLCSIMIPISLKVSLDLVKSVYAKFIEWDEKMFDQETNTSAQAANSAISEDLGQIEYILTDKTGTLTENKMTLRKCFINGTFYGNDSGDALKDVELLNAVRTRDPYVIQFLTIMALCNTVIPIKSSSGETIYKAQSQDEEALVRAAAQLYMALISKNCNTAVLSFCEDNIQYDILEVLEFTSDRRKMSVAVKNLQTGGILLLSKGASEAILPASLSGQNIRPYVDAVEHYSHQGLRTLCMAYRELNEEEYKIWSNMYKEASCSLVDRERKVAKVSNSLECDLKILGVAAIEDRLQDGVPETISTLRNAGIKIWMLTGDKQNTAVQIALLSNLIAPEPKGEILFINGKTEDDVILSQERALQMMRTTARENKEMTFVVDGWALEIILMKNKDTFTELAALSKTAICCRVTPSQKAQLVGILKLGHFRTMAIGDGGNDVRMIQQAHVGIGISGREGLQAARAADYSIGKFKFLKRLILVHGRYSYNRTAFISQYIVYKSLLISFIQIYFLGFSGVSGTSLLNSVCLMAYNVFYTSIPAFASVLDKDLVEDTIMQHPHIFYYSQTGRLLNPSTFVGWFGRSLYHAIVTYAIAVFAYCDETCDMEELAMVALSGCILLQAFVVTLDTDNFTIIQFIAIWGNFLAFYIINILMSSLPFFDMYMIMHRLCREPSYWMTLLLMVGVGIGPLLAIKYFRHIYRPSSLSVLQQMERHHCETFTVTDIEPQPHQPLLYDSQAAKKSACSLCCNPFTELQRP
ncbi:Phospholipid-transporting ATPase [Rhynchospora pubera]|uniref:Phospholipid-transporting ATPase n=1 Tax=Rhynchospora pubera TaxID=906938 RepID=A0AAV8CP71_9POAL|nr:Phospholipid-transporting ATPase [Rhynchospora pubera]